MGDEDEAISVGKNSTRIEERGRRDKRKKRESRRRRRARTQRARRKTKRQAWRAEYGNSQLVRGRLPALKVPTVLSTVLSKYRISIGLVSARYAPYPFFYSFADQRIQGIQKDRARLVSKNIQSSNYPPLLSSSFLRKFFLRKKVKIGCSD